MLKRRYSPFARRDCRGIAADACLGVVFELVEGNADTFPMRFANTLIAPATIVWPA